MAKQGTGEYMHSRQFKFSVCVGLMMLMIGSVIATSAAVGIALAVLGVVIMGVAVLSNNFLGRIQQLFGRESSQQEPLLAPLAGKQDKSESLTATTQR